MSITINFNSCCYKDTSMSKHQCNLCDISPKRYYKLLGSLSTWKNSKNSVKWYLCRDCFEEWFSNDDFENITQKF